ncbi:serine/threonine-protein kinase Nek4 [Aulostomus maculatus]
MGFCEGGDLYHRLKQQKGELLPERQVVEWFVQIAMALQYLHERNILHRDLKTQNIFLTKTNIIKVGDLGIARVLENQNDMASTLIGTPYYMSPELFSNKPYNHKSDVWALGCCVYEMSTLKHAFNAKDMNSLVYRIVEGKLPQMPSKYDPQLGDLIKSMLCKRPDDRPEVKMILRQPYIKRQIAMFLEATKEKTALSRKKAGGGSSDFRPNSVSSVAPPQPKPERLPEPQARVKRKEEKPLHHKVRNGARDIPLPPKPSSPDSLKNSVTSLATISNINIDVQEEADQIKGQVQEPQPSVFCGQAGNNQAAPSVDKESRRRGKQDPSPPRKTVSSRKAGVERKASNGLIDIHPQATLKPGDTYSVSEKKQVADSDERDDTMELLKEADMQNPKLEVSYPERRSAHKPNVENILRVNTEDRNDTGAETHHHTSDMQEYFESTEKLLEPFPPTLEPVNEEAAVQISERGLTAPCQTAPNISSDLPTSYQNRGKDMRRKHGDQDKSKVATPRPLPPVPVERLTVEGRKRGRASAESKKATVTATAMSVSSNKNGGSILPQDRPLTARERRRLRQSQDTAIQSGAVRRASYDVTSTKIEHHNVPGTRSVPDSITETSCKQDKLLERRSDDDEFSSSTSSTERSEGDGSERKTECNDMKDLVHMMTQTLGMDGGDSVTEVEKSGSTSLQEFRLNRKYRDTLVLHGKAREEAENLSLGEIPIGSPSGPAKIRRAIEHLRTNVVKGLGVKLLDRVLEIMEEEDERKRELCLRDQMGEEKYQTYAVMVRQLKFFEEIAFKV